MERVNHALRRLREKHGSGAPPLPTTLDLYRELQAVTPDSLQYLLHDLFEANTFWELETERATAVQTEAGTWQVTLDVQARKVVVDSAGVETELPMNDWVEIGVFAPVGEGEESGRPLYVQMHRIRSGEQTVTADRPNPGPETVFKVNLVSKAEVYMVGAEAVERWLITRLTSSAQTCLPSDCSLDS